MNKNEFKKGIEKLQMAYNQKFTVEKLQLWWNKLKNMETSRYLAQIDKLIATKEFMPNIAEILDNKQIISNYEQRDYSNYDFYELYANNYFKESVNNDKSNR